MLSLKTTAKFRKDYKRMKKQGRDLHLLSAVIDDLLAEKTLDANIMIIPCPESRLKMRASGSLPVLISRWVDYVKK